jgi:hypothetical protein
VPQLPGVFILGSSNLLLVRPSSAEPFEITWVKAQVRFEKQFVGFSHWVPEPQAPPHTHPPFSVFKFFL